MIINAPPAHPQNTGDNPISTCGIAPTKTNIIMATRPNPINSGIFTIIILFLIGNSKRYMVLQATKFVDKYLLVILIFMMVGIPIAFFDPGTGELRAEPLILLFYASIAGMIIIILYDSYKARKKRQAERAKRRSKK